MGATTACVPYRTDHPIHQADTASISGTLAPGERGGHVDESFGRAGRAWHRRTLIPVIALTAMAMKVDQEIRVIAGCDAYIAEPLRYRELYAAIDALLSKGKPQADSKANPDRRTP